MRELEWEDMVVKIDGRLLHHLRLADDIALKTPSISQAVGVLAEFDRLCGKVGLKLNLTKTMFMRNGRVSIVPLFSRNEYLRVLQLRVSRSRSQHSERPSVGARQEEATALRTFTSVGLCNELKH
ncbi:unnamed protein product [Heligmosomoides polygyrus]|uniref:Reverse transcriptase domain-containing protein n=1 Tax=Heligmosomoides polygyrus TaxID=6339 RepID=A0A183GCY8_HELPZ|nr:unnamed protein product [Heligmosomoides polygyrus]